MTDTVGNQPQSTYSVPGDHMTALINMLSFDRVDSQLRYCETESCVDGS